MPFITYKTSRKYQNMIILGSQNANPKHFHSIYIEMNGGLPVKKMNNLTKLNIKLFHICLYHCKDRTLNFLEITYKTMDKDLLSFLLLTCLTCYKIMIFFSYSCL